MALLVEEDLSSTVSSNSCTIISRPKRRYEPEEYFSRLTALMRQDGHPSSTHPILNLSASPNNFRGVVLQPNGRWGAQIYAKQNRVWLGTFDTKVKAAMAYDSAAMKLRNGDNCQRNFPWTKITGVEQQFQTGFNDEALLNMIKDGSYQAKFVEFLMERQALQKAVGDSSENSEKLKKQLFQKELTPSDVGTLNRLVIPKNYAMKYFPKPDRQLTFFDENNIAWNFKYCHWKSSQSFVFTKGWNRYVKAFKLRANDTVRFYECYKEGDKCKARPYYMIKFDRAEDGGDANNEDVTAGGIKRVKLFGVVINA